MTIAEFSRRIELHFWDWAIPTLSASPIVQKWIRGSYQIARKAAPFRNYFIGAGVALFGFSNGIVLFCLFAR